MSCAAQPPKAPQQQPPVTPPQQRRRRPTGRSRTASSWRWTGSRRCQVRVGGAAVVVVIWLCCTAL